MPDPDRSHTFSVSVAGGTYRGASGYAIGAFQRYGNVTVNLRVAGSPQAGTGAAVGMTVGW